MENFIFQNPVKLIMGHGMIARLSKEIPSDKRIMITFGGGSVKKNGVYDQVKEALKDHFTIEFWGIDPTFPSFVPAFHQYLVETMFGGKVYIASHSFISGAMPAVRFDFSIVVFSKTHKF